MVVDSGTVAGLRPPRPNRDGSFGEATQQIREISCTSNSMRLTVSTSRGSAAGAQLLTKRSGSQLSPISRSWPTALLTPRAFGQRPCSACRYSARVAEVDAGRFPGVGSKDRAVARVISHGKEPAPHRWETDGDEYARLDIASTPSPARVRISSRVSSRRAEHRLPDQIVRSRPPAAVPKHAGEY